jgi:hypothetical protein
MRNSGLSCIGGRVKGASGRVSDEEERAKLGWKPKPEREGRDGSR